MAYPDFSDLRSLLRDRLKEAAAGFFLDAELNRWLNDGERDVAAKALCIETLGQYTTTNGVRSVAVPGMKVLAVEYQSATGTLTGLLRMTPKMIGHHGLSGTAPAMWFPWGRKVFIEPVPDDAYMLNITAASLPSVEMSEATDEPQVPARAVPFVIQYAYVRGLIKDRHYGEAAREYRLYAHGLMEMRARTVAKYADKIEDHQLPARIVALSETA